MKTYTVTVYREDRWWIIEAPEVPVVTQAGRLNDVERRARGGIATRLDCEPDAFDIEVTVILPDGVNADIESATQLREEAARIRSEAAETHRRAARRMADAGLTVRDIGTVLGVSHQRAHALLAGR